MATKIGYVSFYSGNSNLTGCYNNGDGYFVTATGSIFSSKTTNAYLFLKPTSIGIPVGSVITGVEIDFDYRQLTNMNAGGIGYDTSFKWRPARAISSASSGSASSVTDMGSEATIKSSVGCSTTWTNDVSYSQSISSVTVANDTLIGVKFIAGSKNVVETYFHIRELTITVNYNDPPHTHSYGSPTYTWSSDGKSCTAKRTCSCGAEENSTATITSAVKTAATCLAKGTTTYTAKFSASWATIQTKDVQDIAQKSHSYTGAIKSNGNGKDATHSFKCVNGCNNYGNATKHTWNSGSVTTQPTCTANGVKTYTCTASGCSATYTESVPATGHSWVDATCTAPKTCSVCGATEGAALGHKYSASLTAEGRRKHTCSCGHSYIERAYDLNFDNLFSFADWAESSCARGSGSGSGSVAYNITNGTITLSGSGDFYTAYDGGSAYYCVPVIAGQEYIFRYDSVSTGGRQAFVFFYDDSGALIAGAIHNGVVQTSKWIGKYDGSHIVFTVPDGCTKVGIRVGLNGTGEATYSNIAIYKTSVGDIVNRQYRKVFFAGATINELYTPVKHGYVFGGWFTGENGSGTQLGSSVTYNQSATIYSKWTKLPPEFTSVLMTYLNKQISTSNKVICNEGFIISVGIG